MRYKTIMFTVLILSLILLSLSCQSSTAPKRGMINGTVHLVGEIDHSGIVVSIYNANSVPDDVRELQQEYPQLAYPNMSNEVFDHRDYQPIQTLYTNVDGSFSFDNLPYGEYIITYRKELWGYNYLFGIVLNSAELDAGSSDELSLYPECNLPGLIEGTYILESNKCYVASNDVVIASNAVLIFQEDTRLLLKQYVKIMSQGSIAGPESPSRAIISSYAGIHSGSISDGEMGEGLWIINDDANLQRLSFSHLGNGLRVTGNNHILEQLSFLRCIIGLMINGSSDVTLSKNFFALNNNINTAACYGYNIQRIIVSNNIYYGSYCALKNEIVKDAVIESNVFLNNTLSFLNSWESTAEFNFNYLKSDGVGVENTGQSNLFLTYNDLNCRICVKTSVTGNWGNTPQLGWTEANMNNLRASESAVSCNAVYYDSGNPVILDFSNNYWGTTNGDSIQALIVDYYDLPPYDTTNGGNWGIVDYTPFKTSSVSNAGVQ